MITLPGRRQSCHGSNARHDAASVETSFTVELHCSLSRSTLESLEHGTRSMGICVPKAAGGAEPADPDELEGDVPLSPTSSKRAALPRMAPGSKSFEEEVRSPDPSPVKGAMAPPPSEGPGAPRPPPRRKASLQMDAADMSKLLTQIPSGGPGSPGGRRSVFLPNSVCASVRNQTLPGTRRPA